MGVTLTTIIYSWQTPYTSLREVKCGKSLLHLWVKIWEATTVECGRHFPVAMSNKSFVSGCLYAFFIACLNLYCISARHGVARGAKLSVTLSERYINQSRVVVKGGDRSLTTNYLSIFCDREENTNLPVGVAWPEHESLHLQEPEGEVAHVDYEVKRSTTELAYREDQ